MTDDRHDYRRQLLNDLAQHRAQHRSASVSASATDDGTIPNLQPASIRQYNRLNRSEPSVSLEPRPPDRPMPDAVYHQRTFYIRALQSQKLRSNYDENHEDVICSEAPFPANMLESYRNRDHERRIQTGLPQARPQQREKYSKLQEELNLRSGSLNSIAFEPSRTDPLQGLSELCENEQKVYDDIFKKVIENESDRCAESGQVLEQIRKSYQEMFIAVPHYISKVQNNMGQMNTVFAQLEHQTQLNRELEARMSQLESEQETLQLERDSWNQEKQNIMEDRVDFQKNFLQLRNFWESERNRYEQQVRTLKRSLQEQRLADPRPSQTDLIRKQMDSFISAALNIMDSAPDFEKSTDSNHDHHSSANNIVYSADPSEPRGEAEKSERVSVPVLKLNSISSASNIVYSAGPSEPHAADLKKAEKSERVSIPVVKLKSITPEFENDLSLDQNYLNSLSLTDDDMSEISESVPKEAHLKKLDLSSPEMDFVSSAPDVHVDPPMDENLPKHHSTGTILEPIISESQDNQMLDGCRIEFTDVPSQEHIDESEMGILPKVDSQLEPAILLNEVVNNCEEEHNILLFPKSQSVPDMHKSRDLNEISPAFSSLMRGEATDVNEGIPSKSYQSPPEPDSQKLVNDLNTGRPTLISNQHHMKAKMSLNFDKINAENLQKEHRHDLNSIEYFGSPSLKSRSLMSSRLSSSSYPGWNASTPVPTQPSKHPEMPRFERRRVKHNLATKSNLTTSLQNLLKQALHYQHNGNVMTEQNLLKLINFILDSCFAATVAKKEKHRVQFSIDLKLYIISLMKEQHGLAEIVLIKWCEMMNSIRKYRPINVFVDLFGDLLEGESDLHVNILLRIRQLLTKSRYGVSMLIQDQHFICQDRAIDVIKSLFCDFITSAAYQQTSTLITQACRPWAYIIHEFGSLDVVKRSQILSPRLNLNMMDVINPHDRRFNCHECGIEVNRFIPLAYQGIRRAELEYERDQWACHVFQSVDHNNDHFISFDQFSRAFSSHTIPQLSNRQLQVMFDKATHQAATKQISLKRFRYLCSQLRHVIFVNINDRGDEEDHLRPTVESIIEKWTRLDPAYNKFVELICNTKSGFDICQRLSYARLVFEGALIYGAKSASIIEKYRLMLGIIAESQPDPTVFMSNTTLIRDIDRLEKLVDLRLRMLMGPGMVQS